MEEAIETNQSGISGVMSHLLDPEALMMLTLAAFIDLGEAVFEAIPFVGTILSGMLDIIALIVIGLIWMRFIRGHKITATKKTGSIIKGVAKAGKKYKWLKLFCVLFEMIPIASSILPGWIFAVLLELGSGND